MRIKITLPFVAEHCWSNREKEREREIAALGCECHKFHCQLHFGEELLIGTRGWIQMFERESRLAADKGIGILTLAVQLESGVSEMA